MEDNEFLCAATQGDEEKPDEAERDESQAKPWR